MLTRTVVLDELGERERQAAKTSKRFPASISSDTPITRRTYDGEWTEVLSHAPGAVDLSRAPLPLLEGHDRSRTNIGIVTDLKLDGGKLRGVVVLGSSARAEELAADIGDGIVRNLSIGYEILEQKRDEQKRRITGTRWRPHETSIVSTPADASVGFGRSTMDPQNPTNPQPPAPDEATRAAVELATRAERERASTIRTLVTRSRLGDEFAEQLVRDGVPLDKARSLILDKLATASDGLRTDQHVRVDEGVRFDTLVAGGDYASDFHRAAVDAILLRSGIRVGTPHAAARDVPGSVYDVARLCLSRAGKSASSWFGGEGRGPELIKRALTTSDFPLILSGSVTAAVRSGYEAEPSSHRAWVRTVPVTDFRTQERPILGSAPELERVLEHGEYHDGSLSEDRATYVVAKYGRVVSLSWEVLVNDNLGAFLRVKPALGQAARRKEADTVYDLFALNGGAGPTMQDGQVLFHADHANLAAISALNATGLDAGRALLRRQTALGGGYLALVPKYLIVPPELEAAAEVLIANAIRRTTTEKATAEWIATLDPVVEPRLTTAAWYLAADSSQIDTFELGLLEENIGGPVLEEEREFRVDTRSWKVRHVLGAAAIDWRGMVRTPTS